jgi:hypothetical protein
VKFAVVKSSRGVRNSCVILPEALDSDALISHTLILLTRDATSSHRRLISACSAGYERSNTVALVCYILHVVVLTCSERSADSTTPRDD